MEMLKNYPNKDQQPAEQTTQQNNIAVEVLDEQNLSRRAFLKAGVFSAGGLVLAFNLPMAQKAYAQTEASNKSFPVKAWLQLNQQNEIVLVVPAAEMGQGSQSALAMIFADELGADYQSIRVKAPLNNPIYNNPIIGIQVTGGSTAVRGWWQPLSEVAATLREMLAQAAANRWAVDAALCQVKDNQVFVPSNNQSLKFADLITDLEDIAPPAKPTLKNPDDYRYIGQSMPRVDTASKVDGSAVFGMDVKLPGMLVATVAQSPVFGGEVDQYNEQAALAVNGVKAVVPIQNGIAVVADSYWQAQKGLQALKPSFSGGDTLGLNNVEIDRRLLAGLGKNGEEVKAAKAVNSYHKSYKSVFKAPYLAHTTMEPMNATAYVSDDKCEVWAPTQNQTAATQVAADVSLMQTSQVVIHTTYLGGGFGRRANVDYIAQAVALSLEMEAPVKVIWSRSEDIQHDFYRPAAVCEFNVKTDQQGMPLEWRSKVVTDSVMASFSGGSDTMIDNAMSEGLADQEYQIANLGVDVVRENLKIPVGFWRSVGHSFSGFFMEGMVNRLAREAKRDPFEYRMTMLKASSRTMGVLARLQNLSDWQLTKTTNIGRGMACVHSFGSYVAQVVDARLEKGQIVVDRVYCVIDCGKVVNPEIVKRQMNSAIIYGLTAALTGEVNFDNGRVVESNFDDYPALTMQQTPEIIVEIVKSNADPGGYGEPGLPPLAPALTAALTALTGQEYEQLPIKL